MKLGDLVKRLHQPIDYGIVVKTTDHSIFIYWSCGEYTMGYNWREVLMCVEFLSGSG